MGSLTREEVERRFPEAVAFAREFRPADPGVKILYARNQQGEELGRLQGFPDPGRYVTGA
jgi:hypothetical protein